MLAACAAGLSSELGVWLSRLRARGVGEVCVKV